MTQHSQTLTPSTPRPTTDSGTVRFVLFLAVGAVLFALMTYWGGLPPEEELAPFLFGVVVLTVLMGALSYVWWHLMIRPLPAGHALPQGISVPLTARRLLGFLVLIAAFSLVTGAFWDEVWHRQYGVPFGEDFFWRPHLMMYFGLGTTILLAFGGLYLLMRSGKGTFQQRFRANPTIGLLVMTGAFLMYAVPADPIWHIIYGADLSAWGVPHLLLALSFSAIAIMGSAIQLSTVTRREWGVLSPRLNDLPVLIGYGLAIMFLMQLLTTEWDMRDIAFISEVVQSRPDWVFGAMIVIIAVSMGTLALHSLRWAGAATVMGLVSLAFRVSYHEVFEFYFISANGWLLLLPILLSLDIVYAAWLRSRGGMPPLAVAGAVGGLAGLAVMFTVSNALFIYPTYDATNALPTALALLVSATGAVIAGRAMGNYLMSQALPETHRETVSPRVGWAALAALVAMALFLVFFISTATPPVA